MKIPGEKGKIRRATAVKYGESMKKLLLLFPLALLLCACLFSCGGKTGEPDETTGSRERGEQVDVQSIFPEQVGLFPYAVASSDLYVSEATVTSSGAVSVRSFEDGTATLTVTDYWGNTAAITVKVENAAVEITVTRPFSDERVANVRLFGATGTGYYDESDAIQRAIDSLPEGGGDVLIPRGIYPVHRLILKEGTRIRMQGKAEDPKQGYTEELAARVEGKSEFAVLLLNAGGNVFYNHDPGTNDNRLSGALGKSNISVSGGVIDMNGSIAAGKVQVDSQQTGTAACGATGTGAAIFSCGENYLFENVIFKDCYNGHVLQLCGVRNVEVRDCMFAGYVARAEVKGSTTDITITRELIQIEYAHTGAIPPSTFEPGEFYYCKNVSVTGCYFGDSDKCADPLICIGQHGVNGPANCDGLIIEDNVFDNPYYCALRLPNYTSVSIRNNRFYSSRRGRPNGYFIELLMLSGDRTFVDENGRTVVVAKSYESDGLQDLTIRNNDFQITGSSNKRVMTADSGGLVPGANAVSGVFRQAPGERGGKSYTGFLKQTYYIGNLDFSENNISIDSGSVPSDYFMLLGSVVGLTFENNRVQVSGVIYGNAWNGVRGIINKKTLSADDIYGLKFTNALQTVAVVLPDGAGGTIRVTADGTSRVLKLLRGSENVRLKYVIDENGDAVVTVECEEGHTFTGWKLNGSDYQPGAAVKISADTTLTATCN